MPFYRIDCEVLYFTSRSYLNGLVVFPTFFNSEFGNKEFMIWTIVSSRSCFCWLYRASPSLAAKYNQSEFCVDHLVMSICRVFSCVVERGCLLWPVQSLGKNSVSLCPASFRIPRPNLPVTPGVSWLPTCAFQSPIMKRTSFLGVSSKRSCEDAFGSQTGKGAREKQ